MALSAAGDPKSTSAIAAVPRTRVIRAREPLDHRRDALLILGPRQVDERLLLEARLGLHIRPLAPSRQLVGLGEQLDLADLLVDVVLAQRRRLGVNAEEEERSGSADEQDTDQDGDGLESAALEIAVFRGKSRIVHGASAGDDTAMKPNSRRNPPAVPPLRRYEMGTV